MEQSKNVTVIEERRHPRIKTFNTVAYLLFDDTGKKLEKGKGRTINLSQSGTLLETNKPLKGKYILLMTIDLQGNKIKLQGRVITTRKYPSTAKYLAGIEFVGSEDKNRTAVMAFVKAYQQSKHKLGDN